MNVVSAVANLVKERDYYRDLVSEAHDVIRQLIDGPGNVEYIHPLDLSELLPDTLRVIKAKGSSASGNEIQIFQNGNKKMYRQSIMMPRKNIKAEVI